MNVSLLKIIIFFGVGIFAGFILFKATAQEKAAALASIRQSNADNTLELRKLQVAFVAIRKEMSGLTGASMAQEEKIDQLQGKLDGLSKKPQDSVKLAGEDFAKLHSIDIGSSPIKGSRNAMVTIVQFVDLQCPFCTRFYPVINEVLKAYPNKVNFVLKNFPLSFHPLARPAAKLALAANEQGKYFEMVELLLVNKAEVNEKKIKEYAKQLRLNTKRLIKDYQEQDARWEKQIVEDIKLGQAVDVRGTPTFYINGRKTQARDLAAFKAELDRILQ